MCQVTQTILRGCVVVTSWWEMIFSQCCPCDRQLAKTLWCFLWITGACCRSPVHARRTRRELPAAPRGSDRTDSKRGSLEGGESVIAACDAGAPEFWCVWTRGRGWCQDELRLQSGKYLGKPCSRKALEGVFGGRIAVYFGGAFVKFKLCAHWNEMDALGLWTCLSVGPEWVLC